MEKKKTIDNNIFSPVSMCPSIGSHELLNSCLTGHVVFNHALKRIETNKN